MHWTASVNIFQHTDSSVTYSLRMWRVAEGGKTHGRADVAVTGSVSTPLSAEPTRWLQAVLAELSRAETSGHGFGKS